MQTLDDAELLRRYVEQKSEQAFETLVHRHVNLVYSAALRQVHNPHTAEEVTQAVFIILARKAGTVRGPLLVGWLLKTARYAAGTELRTLARRSRREQEAHMESTIQQESAGNPEWEQLAPLLDEAMAQLGDVDRSAVVMRFFDKKPLAEVGEALGISSDTAQKRISRAVDKLRGFFLKRGVAISAVTIISLLAANAVQAAPVDLPSAIAAAAALKGTATAGSSTATIIKGTLKIMAWTKLKTTAVVGVGILFAAGTTTVVVKHVAYHLGNYDWQNEKYVSSATMDRVPPQVKIVRSKHPQGGGWTQANGQFLGYGVDSRSLLISAYSLDGTRTLFNDEPAGGRYDYIANLWHGSQAALKKEADKKFGLVAHKQTITTNVYLLIVSRTNAPGITAPQTSETSYMSRQGHIQWKRGYVNFVASYLENYLGAPVFDRTGMKGRYDMTLDWKDDGRGPANIESLKQAVHDQLGLDIVADQQPVEYTIFEKAK